MGGFDWIKDNVGKTLNGMVSEKPRQAIDSNAEGNVEKTPTALASLSLSTPTKTETASIINTPINSAESMGTTNNLHENEAQPNTGRFTAKPSIFSGIFNSASTLSNVVEKFQGNMQTAFSALPLTNTQNMLAAISGKSKIHEAATALNPDKVLLAVGDKGADVAHLNTLLKLDNKDVYDAAAVTAFQEKHNKDYPENPMPVDGIAGKLTITALQKEAAKEFSPTVDAKTTTVAQNVQPLQTPNIIDGINQFYQKAIRTSG